MRIGVIGVGAHASDNLYPNLRSAGLELVAVCARHQDRAAEAAARWGAAQAFDDHVAMLATADLDGVIISVQAADYAPLVESCLAAGKPVLCEKPGAAGSDEALQLAALSEQTGVPVVVGYMKRFAPAYVRARDLIRSATFGRPSLATFTFAMGPWADTALRTYVVDNPVHHLDLARFLLGDIDDIQAHHTEVDGVGHAIAVVARTSSGAVCTFNLCTTASWVQRNEYVEVFGEGESVWVENVDTCTYRPAAPPEQVWRPNYTVPGPSSHTATIMGFVPELEHFRQVASGEAANRSSLTSAAATLRTAETLCRVIGG